MIWEGCRTNRVVTGPMNFKKIRPFFFFRKVVLPGFWGPGCNLVSLIDLANIPLVIRHSAENICMISEGYRTHRGVNGPMNFKKLGRFFFFGKSCSRDFGDPGCHPSTLIDFINTAMAEMSSVEPICMISGGYRKHGGVKGSMKFKKTGFFFRKMVLPEFWGPWLQSNHFNSPCKHCAG